MGAALSKYVSVLNIDYFSHNTILQVSHKAALVL